MPTPIWASPETTSVNRLPMLNIAHLMSISLDGKWNFQLLDRADQEPSKRWQSITVPGLWTMVDGEQPFGDKPIYTNTQMPFDQLPPSVPRDNPTGVYEREFTLPASWKNKRVVLSIGGFESLAILTINGKEVGVAKDSRLASEFDITDFITNGSNKVQIKVIKWSDSTFIEDQYGVGDKVDVLDVQGVVETVGLRITTVRDSKGTIWYLCQPKNSTKR